VLLVVIRILVVDRKTVGDILVEVAVGTLKIQTVVAEGSTNVPAEDIPIGGVLVVETLAGEIRYVDILAVDIPAVVVQLRNPSAEDSVVKNCRFPFFRSWLDRPSKWSISNWLTECL